MPDGFRIIESEFERFIESDEIVDILRTHAEGIAASAQGTAPSGMQVYAKAGVSDEGAFAQAVMRGEGAIAIEFGSKNNPPYAPLRGSLARRR